MQTFFVLLALVFLPFGWFIVRALRYTRETVGDDSPLHRERTYQFSAYQYFGHFTNVLLAFLLVEMILLVYVMAKAAIRQHEPFIFLFVLFFLGFIGFLCFFFYFDWRYWTITRYVTVTLNPDQGSIVVNSPEQDSLLSADTVERIEHHTKKSSNSKDPLGGYGYLLFYTTNGNVTRVNNRFFSNLGQVEFLERFFRNVPNTVIEHRLPWITDLA